MLSRMHISLFNPCSNFAAFLLLLASLVGPTPYSRFSLPVSTMKVNVKNLDDFDSLIDPNEVITADLKHGTPSHYSGGSH